VLSALWNKTLHGGNDTVFGGQYRRFYMNKGINEGLIEGITEGVKESMIQIVF
jgi:hypothetical protein